VIARRDRLLMLVPVMPSDRGHGLAMRAAFFLDAYSRRFETDLVVVPVAGAADITAFARARARRIEVLSLGQPETHYRLAASVRDPLARVEALRRYGRPSLAARIGPIGQSLDSFATEGNYAAVHVFRLYLAELAVPWLDQQSHNRPRLLLDCDENDALVYRRLAAMERRRQDPIAAALADAEAEAFAKYVSTWLPRFDVAITASDREMKSLAASAASAAVIPNVIALPAARPRSPRDGTFSILFVGTLGYAPNADAVIWFISRVWKRFQRVMNFRARLAIVGSNPPPAVIRLAALRGVEVKGAVVDLAPYYRQADLVIAPVRAGGGTRIKVIEAAAHGVAIVASRLAAEGTTFQPGIDMLVADQDSSFLRACLLLARNRSLASRLASQARARVKRDHSPAYWRARVLELVADGGEPPGSAVG
jgi:glycosyltransferase involved in cell wall biosynthesis